MTDTTVMRKNLRRDTAKLLKYDVDNLTAAQSVRLDRACMLRLELSDVEERKLNNNQQPFDTNKYIAASEALERIFGSDPNAPIAHDFHEDAEKLAQLFHRRHAALERRRESQEAEKANRLAFLDEQHQGVAPTATNVPVESPPAEPELMPEGSEPPSSNVHHSYIDYAVLEEIPTDRHRRINGGDPQPATQKPPSPATQSFFSDAPAAGGLGPLKRGADWMPR